MKTKQTAVEWLIEVLWAPCQGIPSDIIDQAKQMEKAQIIRARVDGDEHHTFNSQMREEYAEDYYKENYGE